MASHELHSARPRFPRVALATLLALLGGAVGCEPVSPGLWSISGEDERFGSYVGLLEIRPGEGGDLDAIRVVRFDGLERADGRIVEAAWTGGIARPTSASPALRFSLLRADFISEVDGLVRTEADALPLEVEGALTIAPGGNATIAYAAEDDPGFGIRERGVLLGPPDSEPIFAVHRLVRETHAEPKPAIRRALFDLFESYHALPELQPYLDHPAFRRAVHYQVEERTDFEYHRDHPEVIRVVNKVIDPIALAESEVRANAFRATAREKADHYQAEFTRDGFLRPHGMTVGAISPEGAEIPNGDAALWTGVYALTQALRYRHTGDAGALADVRTVLEGAFTLMDITGEPTTFARTLRASGPPITGGWVRGEGAYAGVDWLRGGNNDMSVGLALAFVAALDALPPGDPLREDLAAHALDLLELCVFREDTEIGACEGNNPLLGVSLNPGTASLIAGLANDDARRVERGLAWLRQPAIEAYARIGGGPFYLFGISDWSGNHLTFAHNLALVWLLERAGDTDLERTWKEAAGPAWRWLAELEHPLHAVTAHALGRLDAAERAETRDQAIWALRSFPLPKHTYPVDHRIRADFLPSPFPSWPWFLDWETNPERRGTLVGHGLLESVVDNYHWNGSVHYVSRRALGEDRVSGADYLFLYWLARDAGLIDALD